MQYLTVQESMEIVVLSTVIAGWLFLPAPWMVQFLRTVVLDKLFAPKLMPYQLPSSSLAAPVNKMGFSAEPSATSAALVEEPIKRLPFSVNLMLEPSSMVRMELIIRAQSMVLTELASQVVGVLIRLFSAPIKLGSISGI